MAFHWHRGRQEEISTPKELVRILSRLVWMLVRTPYLSPQRLRLGGSLSLECRADLQMVRLSRLSRSMVGAAIRGGGHVAELVESTHRNETHVLSIVRRNVAHVLT